MPDYDVNASRSTSGAHPTALCVGVALGNLRLIAAMHDLIDSFRMKSRRFGLMVAVGRTRLQNGVPMTLAQEFSAFADTLAGEVRALEAVQRVLWEDALGAAAIEATQDAQTCVLYSSSLKGLAMTLSKICHDLRLLSSGSRHERREISPPSEPRGSSSVPGKVNPANAVIAAHIFEAQTMLIEAIDTLRVACVEGVIATPEVHQHDGDDGIAIRRLSTRRPPPWPEAS
jgi:aspartate ammonia-lyase